MSRVVGLVALWLLVLAPLASGVGTVPEFKKVMVIIFENTDEQDALAQKFMTRLVQGGALLSNFWAEAHPSQPNDIALIAGDTHHVSSDRNVDLDARHLGDLLEDAGKTWKVYAESYPGECFQGARQGTYVRKHVPFVSFKNVQSNLDRCGRIVDAGVLKADVAAGTLPDVSLYIPDLNDDGHDTGVTDADRWLQQTFEPMLQDPKFMDGMLLIVTFDESGGPPSPNHIFTVLYGNQVTPGATSDARFDHYSLLRTLELGFGLGNLGRHDATAPEITGVWKSSALGATGDGPNQGQAIPPPPPPPLQLPR